MSVASCSFGEDREHLHYGLSVPGSRPVSGKLNLVEQVRKCLRDKSAVNSGPSCPRNFSSFIGHDDGSIESGDSLFADQAAFKLGERAKSVEDQLPGGMKPGFDLFGHPRGVAIPISAEFRWAGNCSFVSAYFRCTRRRKNRPQAGD
jgi:hypothetical protein